MLYKLFQYYLSLNALQNKHWILKKENSKDHFGPNLGHKLFGGFNLTGFYTLSQAAILCNNKENQWPNFEKMTKTLISDPIWGPNFFSMGFTSINSWTIFQAITPCFERKTNEQNLIKWKKKLGPILACFGTNFIPQKCSVGFISTRCDTLLQAIIASNFKEN